MRSKENTTSTAVRYLSSHPAESTLTFGFSTIDVTACIDQALFTEVAEDRVRLSGITGLPPPATTKAGVSALGGYKVEMNWALVGLDIEEKKRLFEVQLRHSLGKERLSKISYLDLTVYGSVAENPRCQNAATVDMRLVVQAKDEETVNEKNLAGPAFSFIMETFPAATYTNKSITPKPVRKYSSLSNLSVC
jgi:hypothetical protein